MTAIAADSHVTLHYRVAVVLDGVERELVNTFAAKPATLQMGAGQWSSHLERCLLGLPEGAQADFTLPPAQAYGERHPELVRHVTRAALQAQAKPGWTAVAGETVEITSPEGVACQGTLVAVDDSQAQVDFNHPLAGKGMKLSVQIIGVL